MSIADKLTLLADTKEALRVKLDLGADVPFSEYVDYIEQQNAITKLFLNGKQGVWYDPSDKSTLFQDVAGTVPVTKDGDPVGLIKDKSGNGNHATQSVSAARPIYRTDGLLHWLEFDGIEDYIVFNFIPDGKVDVNLDYINKKESSTISAFLSKPDTTALFTFGAHPNQATYGAVNSGGGQIIIDAVSKPNMSRAEFSQLLDKGGHIQMTLSNTSLWDGGMQISGYANSSWYLKGSLGQFVIHRHTTPDDTMITHKILANRAGISL